MTEYANPKDVVPAYASPDAVTQGQTPQAAPEMDLFRSMTPESLKTIPAAYRDVVLRQIQTGDPSVLAIPAVQPIIMDFLKTHPAIAKMGGAMLGTAIGVPGGPGGMIAGGAAGASLADSASQLSEMGSPAAPQTARDALVRSGTAAGEGALAGATGAGTIAGAPTALRLAASPAGGAAIAGGTTLYQTGDPLRAMEVAGLTAMGLKGLPMVSKVAGKMATAIENRALSARIAHTLNREAPEAVAAAGKVLQFGRASSSMPSEMAATMPRMVPGASQAAKALEGAGLSPELATAEAGKMAGATGEVSGNLPGVVAPLKMPAISLAEDIQAQVAKLRASGLSKPQITAAVREAHNLEPGAAGRVVDTIFEHSGARTAATAEAVPAGSRVMPPYRGGKAQPSLGPARVPTSDKDLMSLLQGSIDAYKIK